MTGKGTDLVVKETQNHMISSTLKFEKDDLVNIAVAKAEQNLKKAQKEASTKRNALLADHKKAENAWRKDLHATGKAACVQKVKDFNSFYSKMGIKCKIDSETSINVPYINESDPQSVTIKTTLIVQESDRDHDVSEGTELCTFDVKVTSAQKKALTAIQKIAKEADQAGAYAIECRTKLADIDTVERQMRAIVAQCSIERSKEGKDLIEAMMKQTGLTDSVIDILGV